MMENRRVQFLGGGGSGNAALLPGVRPAATLAPAVQCRCMCVLGSWAEVQSQDEFGGGVKGDPDPEI
jgi:hypothetical protein